MPQEISTIICNNKTIHKQTTIQLYDLDKIRGDVQNWQMYDKSYCWVFS